MSKPYEATESRGGKTVSLGYFATAEEAALCIARTPEGRAAAAGRRLGGCGGRGGWGGWAAAAAAPPPMTAEEAVRQAEAEGLTLLKAGTVSGYKGVFFNSSGTNKPYKTRVPRGGKPVSLGCFATAERGGGAVLCADA